MKRVIVNADDFGLVDDVNLAILDAHLAGSVTSTTMLVNSEASEAAARMAADNPALGVGLHFNLTLGRPVSEAGNVSTLVDADGQFFPRGKLARRLLRGAVRAVDVARELEAQLSRLRALGVVPTHLDSHQHIHGFPMVFDVVATWCDANRTPMRMPWVLQLPGAEPSIGRRLRQWLLRRMLARNAARWAGRVTWNDSIGSVFDLGDISGAIRVEHYRALLAAAPPGVFELMVHPARDASKVKGLTDIGSVSESEWRFLTSGELTTLIREFGFSQHTFGDAWR